jgi:hypothetical protein
LRTLLRDLSDRHPRRVDNDVALNELDRRQVGRRAPMTKAT